MPLWVPTDTGCPARRAPSAPGDHQDPKQRSARQRLGLCPEAEETLRWAGRPRARSPRLMVLAPFSEAAPSGRSRCAVRAVQRMSRPPLTCSGGAVMLAARASFPPSPRRRPGRSASRLRPRPRDAAPAHPPPADPHRSRCRLGSSRLAPVAASPVPDQPAASLRLLLPARQARQPHSQPDQSPRVLLQLLGRDRPGWLPTNLRPPWPGASSRVGAPPCVAWLPTQGHEGRRKAQDPAQPRTLLLPLGDQHAAQRRLPRLQHGDQPSPRGQLLQPGPRHALAAGGHDDAVIRGMRWTASPSSGLPQVRLQPERLQRRGRGCLAPLRGTGARRPR
jgi:hypothetical protein